MEDCSEYLIIRSASTALASVTNKLSDQVNDKIQEGWAPLGRPTMIHVSEKYVMTQSMIR